MVSSSRNLAVHGPFCINYYRLLVTKIAPIEVY